MQSPELGDSFCASSQQQAEQLTAPIARGKVVKESFLCQGSKTETLQGKEIRKVLSSLTSAIGFSLLSVKEFQRMEFYQEKRMSTKLNARIVMRAKSLTHM